MVEWSALRANLQYEKNTNSPTTGLILMSAHNGGLLKGDRVEPSWECKDTGQILQPPRSLPLQITFWRRSAETRARHRHPLFDSRGRVAIGITVALFAIDVLHTIHLGLAQFIVLFIFWKLIGANVWNVAHAPNAGDNDASVQRLEHELAIWYRERARRFPDEKLSQVKTLKAFMIRPIYVIVGFFETGQLSVLTQYITHMHFPHLSYSIISLYSGELYCWMLY